MMGTADIEKITTVMKSMIQYELTLADFYKKCADRWTADQPFWQNLAQAEVGHADNIQKIQEIILKKPERFELGRPFNTIALNTAMAGINNVAGRVAAGALSLENTLITARDFEQSILESHYGEVVKSADFDYQTLMKSILSQTHEHKKMIQERIAQKGARI